MDKISSEEREFTELSPEDANDMQYYTDSVIIKMKDNVVDEIATCFDIEKTMNALMLAPIYFITQSDNCENEKEIKERLWKQVRQFYTSARDILDKRYRL